MVATPTIDRGIVDSIVHSIEGFCDDAERLVVGVGLTEYSTNPELDVLPEDRVWMLFQRTAQSLDMPDVGLRVGAGFQVRDLGEFGRQLESGLTTYSCLTQYIDTVNRYSSHSEFWLEQQPGGAWFCRRGIDLIDVGIAEVEQFTVELMIRLVQIACGPTWRPIQVHIQNSGDRFFRQCQEYNGADVRCGQQATAIWLSETDLLRVVRHTDDEITRRIRDSICVGGTEPALSIRAAAQQVGFSVRTVQRELARRGFDWSRLLDQVRLDHAVKSLAGEIPICELAQILGYTDQANFGRAFRRWTGTTPKSYRRRLRDPKLQ